MTQLTDQFALVKLDLPKKSGYFVYQPTNLIWIRDRSGSMRWELPQLTEDLCKKVDQLRNGDFLTSAWFSGRGEYHVEFKGVEITPENRDKIKLILWGNASAIGMTCFSEVLTEASSIIDDLKFFSHRFSIVFLTDGYPTVSPYEQEIKDITAAIQKVSALVTSALIVGYGNFYNRELLAKMSQSFGGILLHSSNLKDFSLSLDSFLKDGLASQTRQEVPVTESAFAIFSLPDLSVYAVNEGMALIDPSKDTYALVTTSDPGKAYDPLSVLSPAEIYGACHVLCQLQRLDVAQEILSRYGDEELCKFADATFTTADFGVLADKFASRTKHPLLPKFLKPNCLPDPNAYSVLDFLDELVGVEGATLLTNHPSFKYRRIGPAQVTADGFPKFEPDKDKGSSLSGLTWNEDRLNLSIKTLSTGKVKLGDDHDQFGFAEYFPTHIWRDYTIIRDGFLNVEELPILSGRIFAGVDGRVSDDGGLVVYDLRSLPLVNRASMMNLPTASDLATMCISDLALEAQAKVYRSLINEHTEKVSVFAGLTIDQNKYLKAHGITPGGFNPPSIKAPPTDYYDATELRITIKGFSQLPSLNEIRKRREEGKTPTPPVALMLPVLKQFEDSVAVFGEEQFDTLPSKLAAVVSAQRKLRSVIQRAKFALVVGKRWWPEFPNRDKCQLKVGDYTVDFLLKPVRIEF